MFVHCIYLVSLVMFNLQQCILSISFHVTLTFWRVQVSCIVEYLYSKSVGFLMAYIIFLNKKI